MKIENPPAAQGRILRTRPARRAIAPSSGTIDSFVACRANRDVVIAAAFLLGSLGGSLLAVRRLAGGFAAPESALPALLAGTSFAAIAWLLAASLRRVVERARPTLGFDDEAAAPVAAIALLPAVVIAFALLPARPAATLVGLAGVWAISGYGAYRRAGGRGMAPALRQSIARLRKGESSHPADVEHARDFDDSDLVQWQRRREGSGQPVEGGLRIEFQPGQMQIAAHVPFVPPLDGIPEVDCRTSDPSLRVKAAAVYSYGIRFDIRRTEACDEPASAALTFSARPRG